MSLEIDRANEYLLGPVDTVTGLGPLWRWDDRGAVVTWADGTTIVYSEGLLPILERLAPDGLPPLLSVLVVLSATRDNWPEVSRQLLGPAGVLRKIAVQYEDDLSLLDEVVAGLDRIQALPSDQRTSRAGRIHLCEVIFEFCGERGTKRSAESVLWALRHGSVGPAAALITSSSGLPPKPRVVHDLSCLIEGLQCFHADRLTLRGETGLDEVPEPADVAIPPGERVRGLLAQLADDAELCGLASLTRDLMAAMTLPRAISDPDELPQGGVSDLTNRGPLDRLLLSELAHDDLTLAVRIATGSALYWRRERPPQPKPRQRSLLLEAGLRSWGVPRVFATAVALAVAATADSRTSLACHRARAGDLVPVDLTTRPGLVEHLAALEPEAHPGAALTNFAETVSGDDLDTDAVLVLGEDVFADRDFQGALAASGLAPLLIATVNREGGFTLHSRTPRGSTVLRQAKLDLEALFRQPKPTSKRVALIDPSRKHDGPAIQSVKPFPLRIPNNWNPKALGRIEGAGILEVTRNRRLLLWETVGLGPRQLADDMPHGALLWYHPDLVEGRIVAVVGHLNNAQMTLIVIHKESDQVEKHPLALAERSYRGVCAYQGVFFAIHKRGIQSFSMIDGEPRGTLTTPLAQGWFRDRFFQRGDNIWYAVSHDGQQPVFRFTARRDGSGLPWLITLFEQPGIDGPIGVTHEGHLYFTATGRQTTVQHGILSPIAVVAIRRRGNAVLLSGKLAPNNEVAYRSIDVPSGKVLTPVYDFERFNEVVRPPALRSRFQSIGVHGPLNALVLLGRDNLALVYDPATQTICLRPVTRSEMVACSGFHRLDETRRRRPLLRVVSWCNGSKAFLDARGMLHLQSSDLTIPEVSIVLKDGPLAGWCADGTLWGERFFTGVEPDGDSVRHVWETAIEPFVRRLS